jgi:putative FmdB family regulatory protein
MPTFDYKCGKCGYGREVLVRIHAEVKIDCPVDGCDGILEKQLSSPYIHSSNKESEKYGNEMQISEDEQSRDSRTIVHDLPCGKKKVINESPESLSFGIFDKT